MTENMGNWPSGHRKTEKSGHRMATEKILFSRRWYGGLISTNQAVIWEISVNLYSTRKVASFLMRNDCPIAG